MTAVHSQAQSGTSWTLLNPLAPRSFFDVNRMFSPGVIQAVYGLRPPIGHSITYGTPSSDML